MSASDLLLLCAIVFIVVVLLAIAAGEVADRMERLAMLRSAARQAAHDHHPDAAEVREHKAPPRRVRAGSASAVDPWPNA